MKTFMALLLILNLNGRTPQQTKLDITGNNLEPIATQFNTKAKK